MIPFARVLKYENIAPPKEEVKSFGASASYFSVLSTKGDLYVSGSTNISYFGVSNTTLTKIGDGIANAWYSLSGSDSVVILKEGKYYQRGAYYGAGVSKTWYDLSTVMNSLFSKDPSAQLMDLQVTPSLYALMSNGDLYAIGLNSSGQMGTGNTYTQFSWVLLGSNVKKFIAGQRTVVYLTNDGSIYGCGSNFNGTLLGADRTTFFKIGTGVYDSLYCVGRSNIKNILMHNTVDNFWYGTGTNTVGRGGTLANGNIVSRFTATPANMYRNNNNSEEGNTSSIVIDGQLYICGWNMWGQTGLGINANSNTDPFTIVPGATDVVFTLNTDQTSFYMNSSKEVYGCGYGSNDNMPGLNGQRVRYTKLVLPF